MGAEISDCDPLMAEKLGAAFRIFQISKGASADHLHNKHYLSSPAIIQGIDEVKGVFPNENSLLKLL